MPAYNVIFFGVIFFIVGLFLGSLRAGWLILGATLIGATFFFLLSAFKKDKKFICLALLSPLIFAGAFYYTFFDLHLKSKIVSNGEEVVITGRVVEKPSSSYGVASVVVETDDGAKLLLRLPRYPEVKYGEIVSFRGKIEEPASDSRGNYLLKEGIVGTADFPEVESVDWGKKDYKAYLFDLRDNIVSTFQRSLPPKEGAFLSGLLLGETSGFSEDFKNDMKASGTTHLVALSGYNISLVVMGAMFLFSFLLPRFWSFVLTSISIFLFVAMTGAEPSVVRAAIMGFLVLLAKGSGRLFDSRNVVVLTALVMLLLNPRLLFFDVGFELSFLAFLGIVYLEPALISGLAFFERKGFARWRENLATTFSAQVMVLPILLGNFGSFSPVSLISNVLLLGLVPGTMMLGFVTASLGFLSKHLAQVGGWVVLPFLKFETGIIEFFGGLGLSVSFDFGWILFALYYLLILLFVVWRKKTCRN